jgi:hypothetical protein
MATRKVEWATVLAIAARLGVSYAARMKWKERGSVPHKWRRAIILASDGALSWADLEK